MIKLNSAGETIVEVLLSAALLGLAITTSFAIARTSLDLGIEAKERTQALKIAESQIEMLKFLATQPEHADGLGIFDPTRVDAFCLDRDAGLYPSNPGNIEIINDTGSNPSNLTCGSDGFPESAIRVAITYNEPGPTTSQFDNDTYTVEVSWDEVRSPERNDVTLVYRLHPLR